MIDPPNGLDMRRYDGWTAQNAWAERNGLRASQARQCPLVVAGRRCLQPRNGSCICGRLRNEHRAEHGRMYDHVRIWQDGDGGHVLTLEPYECTAEKVEALAGALRPLGLCVEADAGESPWFPGRTTLIVVTRERAGEG